MTVEQNYDLQAIADAKAFANTDDIFVGWFLLRDLAVTKKAGLSDMAWSGHETGVTKNELLWLIAKLEKHLAKPTSTPKPNE